MKPLKKSTGIPVSYTHLDVYKRQTLQGALINQDSLQPLYTTGTVFHVYMERELEDWKKARDLLSSMITEHHIPCFTLSPVYTICQTCLLYTSGHTASDDRRNERYEKG